MNISIISIKICVSKNEKLKEANNALLNRMIKERTTNRLYLLKPYLDQLKLESKTPKVTQEIALNIERLLTGMGIVGRLDFIRHLKYIKSSGKNRNDSINTETEIMISSMMNAIVTYLEKEYFYRYDRNIHTHYIDYHQHLQLHYFY